MGPRAIPRPDPKLMELSARQGTAPRPNTVRRPLRLRRTPIDEKSAVVTIVPTALVGKGLPRAGTEKGKPILWLGPACRVSRMVIGPETLESGA